MDPQRVSQHTQPSTNYNDSQPQHEPETNTSLHNSILTNQPHPSEQSHRSNTCSASRQVQQLRTYSQRIPQINQQLEMRAQSNISKSQIQQPHQPSRPSEKNSSSPKNIPQQQIKQQSSYGQQNLLDMYNTASHYNQNSQAQSNLLDFGFKISQKRPFQKPPLHYQQSSQVQSNLLDFGYTISESIPNLPKNNKHIKSQRNSNQVLQQTHQSQKKKIPMQIESINNIKLSNNKPSSQNINVIQNQSHANSSEIANFDSQFNYRNEITELTTKEEHPNDQFQKDKHPQSQRQNRFTQKIEKEPFGQDTGSRQIKSIQRQNRALLGGYYDAKQQPNLPKLSATNKSNQRVISIFHNEPSLQSNVTLDPQESSKQKEQFSLESVIKSLKDLSQQKDEDKHRFQSFTNIIRNHIDLIFMEPKDHIGQKILTDGSHAILFVKLMVLRESDLEERKNYQKVLTSSISNKISINQQIFSHFKQQYWPQRKQAFQQTTQKKPSQIHQNNLYDSHANDSIQGQDQSIHDGPRSILKSSIKPQITQPRTQMPVRRQSIILHTHPNTLTASQPNAPKRVATKKRVTLPNQDNLQQTGVVTKKRVTLPDQDSPKKRKDKKQRRLLGAEQYQKNLNLGSGYTHLQMQQNNQTVLVTVRASHRLFEKSQQLLNNKQIPSKKPSRRKSQRIQIRSPMRLSNTPPRDQAKSSKKRSIRKTNQKVQGLDQLLNVDYIKHHFRQIKIQNSKMINNFTPLTAQDREITQLFTQYDRLQKEQQQAQAQEISQLSSSPSRDPEEGTVNSQRNHPSQQRIAEKKQQIKKKLQKMLNAPIIVQRIVNPDINNHGIYALVQLSKVSSFILKAKYFVTPISDMQYASKRFIDEDLKTIRELVQEPERDNIGSMAPNSDILKIIQQHAKNNELNRRSDTHTN